MKRLDNLLSKIKCNSEQKLKSEEIFDKYTEAKDNLNRDVQVLSKIIEDLNKKQLDILTFKY